jgi:hypothetical protein
LPQIGTPSPPLHERARDSLDVPDRHQVPVSADDFFFVLKPADVRLIIEIGHAADALTAGSPMADYIEIALDMLQNFEAHDHIIRPGVALGVTSVSYEEAVIAPGSLPSLLNSDLGKIEPIIPDRQGLHGTLGERSSSAANLQNFPMRRRIQASAYLVVEGKIDGPPIVTSRLFVFCKLAIVYLRRSFPATQSTARQGGFHWEISYETE